MKVAAPRNIPRERYTPGVAPRGRRRGGRHNHTSRTQRELQAAAASLTSRARAGTPSRRTQQRLRHQLQQGRQAGSVSEVWASPVTMTLLQEK